MERESCQVCGGDGRVSNAFGGSSATCPACHGTGRRTVGEVFRDVTKTKPSHHGVTKAANVKATEPTTAEGAALGREVKGSGLGDDAKARLIREIIEYETTHGKCTQTFTKKIRRHIRPATA